MCNITNMAPLALVARLSFHARRPPCARGKHVNVLCVIGKVEYGIVECVVVSMFIALCGTVTRARAPWMHRMIFTEH